LHRAQPCGAKPKPNILISPINGSDISSPQKGGLGKDSRLMMAWPEGPGTARTVTGPRTGSAATAGGASQAGTAPTARTALRSRPAPRRPATDAHRPAPYSAPPLSPPSQIQRNPWSSLAAGLASTSLRSPGPAARRTDPDPGPMRASPIVRTARQRERPGTAFLLLLPDQDAGHCRIADLGTQMPTGDRHPAATPRNYSAKIPISCTATSAPVPNVCQTTATSCCRCMPPPGRN